MVEMVSGSEESSYQSMDDTNQVEQEPGDHAGISISLLGVTGDADNQRPGDARGTEVNHR